LVLTPPAYNRCRGYCFISTLYLFSACNQEYN
jgi:hypothetical protein